MRIAIDVTPLSTGHSVRGIGAYTRNLVSALEIYERSHTYVHVTRTTPLKGSVDVMHIPYFDPFFLTLPLHKPFPTVVTVHDLIPILFPDKFPSGIRGQLAWHIQKRSLHGAQRIITDSVNSQRDIERLTGIMQHMIDVVYLAPDPGLSFRNRRIYPHPYFLYVGDVNWNKNIPVLLHAFADIPNSHLVCVGEAFKNTNLPETMEIYKLMDRLGITARVFFPGYVSGDQLAAWYSGALALIQPSLYEGFGLPVLEAFACRCPVISSDVSSLREISGPAMTIDPKSADSLTKAMVTIHTLSSSARKACIDKGTAWVHNFTWKKVAKETVSVYEKAYNTHTGI